MSRYWAPLTAVDQVRAVSLPEHETHLNRGGGIGLWRRQPLCLCDISSMIAAVHSIAQVFCYRIHIRV